MNAAQYKHYLHSFRCVVCDVTEGVTYQRDVVQTHHVQDVRDEFSGWALAPLCVFHHGELHRLRRRGFERAYKLDSVKLLAHTIRLIMESVPKP